MTLRRAVVAVLLLVLLAGFATIFVASRASAAPCGGQIGERTEHRYNDGPGTNATDHSLDVVAIPNTERCPVLVWVHGGSWQAGDKRSRATTVKAEHYVDQGWAFVSVNYRLASEDNDTRWPDFGNDVADAVAWTIENAESFGGDPDNITIMGHSSGAHLVSIVGTNPTLLERSNPDVQNPNVSCVVSLDSVTQDLTDAPPWEVDIIELSFPSEEQKIDGSPTLVVEGSAPFAGPEFLIVTRGRDERIDSSERLAAAINNEGGTATVLDVSPYDHGEVSTMLGVDGETLITTPVDEFLNTCRTPAVAG